MMKQIKSFSCLLKGCCPAAVATTPGEAEGVAKQQIGAKLKPTFLIKLLPSFGLPGSP